MKKIIDIRETSKFDFGPSKESYRRVDQSWVRPSGATGVTLWLQGFHAEWTGSRHFDFGAFEIYFGAWDNLSGGWCRMALRDDTWNNREWSGWAVATVLFWAE